MERKFPHAAAAAASGDGADNAPASVGAPGPDAPSQPAAEPKTLPWPSFLRSASDSEIKARFAHEIGEILKEEKLDNACCLALLEPVDGIDTTDLDNVFHALSADNPDHKKDVILFLHSRGGRIEPAYQISKLCKSFAKNRFVAVVPREAKSAATLIALGADEIHIGPLGQLGPIDPQLGELPALGVSQALDTIATVAERYPGSAEMFARYLRKALTVEQIGYCDRISESAAQYAQRLLATKADLATVAGAIARKLVHEYKDHGFVIDLSEAQTVLGSGWVKTGTQELKAAERMYTHFHVVNLVFDWAKSRRILVLGAATNPDAMMIFKNERH